MPPHEIRTDVEDRESLLRQELNSPPGDSPSDPPQENLTDMTDAGDRSAADSGLPPPGPHPGDEQRESGLA